MAPDSQPSTPEEPATTTEAPSEPESSRRAAPVLMGCGIVLALLALGCIGSYLIIHNRFLETSKPKMRDMAQEMERLVVDRPDGPDIVAVLAEVRALTDDERVGLLTFGLIQFAVGEITADDTVNDEEVTILLEFLRDVVAGEGSVAFWSWTNRLGSLEGDDDDDDDDEEEDAGEGENEVPPAPEPPDTESSKGDGG